MQPTLPTRGCWDGTCQQCERPLGCSSDYGGNWYHKGNGLYYCRDCGWDINRVHLREERLKPNSIYSLFSDERSLVVEIDREAKRPELYDEI
jgi:hypothetical protein